jgi:hypothetical protein
MLYNFGESYFTTITIFFEREEVLYVYDLCEA